ncbi:MAG: DUF5776 domain-containing protein [Gemella haemolysans]|uniref:DUF5776 domain-containing protein n=1 Tax=Gemella haemolysans TaxID=1379 RepID=UPI00290BA8DE|nr:DUF5776 domain-containing protein [Gemella haemolysans]MDU4713460.1 DUF5776 domain-containing protein [Gemella haemolysans]
MSKEEKDIVVKNDTTDTTEEKDNSTSFFGRLKNQVKTLNFKNNESKDNEKTDSHIDESAIEKELREKEKEVKKQEQELKKRALELEKAKKQFEEQQRKIEEEKKKNELARAERERLEKERIAREKELERQRIEKEKAEKREQERLEKERIAREKELERQRIEKEKAEKREQERLEKERIAREKELERQRIEKEKAEQREKDRLEKERIEKEQEEKRKREFRRKEKEFKLSEDKKKLELLQKENEMREHENTLLSLQTSLISLEDKIEEKKLTISTLKNRNADKEKIMLEEKRLNVLNSQRQVVLKDITTEKKAIEKIQKNLDIEYKLDGLKKEIHSIKKEVVNEDETAFKVKYIDNKPKNIFMVSLLSIKAFISKSILRNKVENYDKIKKVAKNIKVRIATSIILALFLSICFLVTLKFISSAKEHYISFGETNNSAVDTTDELKKQKEAEEKEKILKAQEQANAVRIDSEAQDEEITAKLAGTFSSYSFDVDREVTVNKKIHAFKSASWSEPVEVIEPGTKLTVDKIVSPAGYIMYHISSGNLQGQYITANEKFVSVDKKNDQLENFISRPVAIKFLTTQNIYSDESLSSVRSTYGNGAQLNINGIGISKNNRLIYHVADGSFVPVNPIRVIETNREAPKQKSNDNKNTTNSQNTQNQNTQKKTTR